MSDVSGEAHENFRIVVNGELKSVHQEVLTYEEVVQLAFPDPGDKIYSVTFEKARHPHEGECSRVSMWKSRPELSSMLNPLVARSPDLTRLVEEGYDLEIRDGNLLIHHVPFLDQSRTITHGILVSELTTNGEQTFGRSNT